MTQPTADPLVGRTVDHYEIESRLGGGGMGVVYKARDRKLGRPVALKFLPQQWSHDEGAKQRFLREAQAASATHHPNICTIHDIARADDGQLFIVMGYYEGPTLKQRLGAGPLGVDDALEIATQVADGLAKAHAQGVVHRDIKPGNLILTEDGVRIVDFGLATFVDALQLTADGSTVGTAAYMSPEQVRGQEADARSDVWALGVVLYEMLAGHVPFRGAYAEAIVYAIRTDAPAPLRAARPEIPEEVEQLVFRALHKDPAIRFQSGRELARALREVRGLTVPQDLRTMAVEVRAAQPAPPAAARRRSLRAVRAMAALVAVALIGTPLWLLAPVEPVAVAVTPMGNHTGTPELDAYRMALTSEIVSQLAASGGVRVLPYERLLEIVQAFRAPGRDVASREALEVIAASSGADVLLVPTLVYENKSWKARVEFRDPSTAISSATVETDAVTSSLARDTAYRLSVALAARIGEHVASTGPLRRRVVDRLRAIVGRRPPPAAPRLRTLEAAAAFERGLQAYEQVELKAAFDEFGAAAALDSGDPLPLAWRSRAALLMRQDEDALDAAVRAERLLSVDTRLDERLFVEAVAAEARGDADGAERRYRELVSRHPDSATWAIELAASLDRQGNATEAVAAYHAALDLDDGIVRARVELCRLNSPSRLNEPVAAKEQGELAVAAYRSLGHQSGEAQALWCLADILRAGGDEDRRLSRQHAESALTIMQTLQYPFGLARAYHYMGVVALLAERNGREAAGFFEDALPAVREVGNRFLEPRVLMNLGVSHELFGDRASAVTYYRESFTLFESLRSQQEAAWSQMNAAAILIDYGGDMDQGLRDAQNALKVFEAIGDKYFEVFARRMIALSYRLTGRVDEALRELALARSVAAERNLDDRRAQVLLELARLRFHTAEYPAAQAHLVEALGTATGTDRVHARIELARVQARLGRFDEAAAALAEAARDAEANNDDGSLPLLYAARGELAYESGRLAEARREFGRAADFWTDDLPEAASVEARAYAGLIDALQGTPSAGRAAVVASLAQARRMRRVALEARCLLFLARIQLADDRPEEARRTLEQLPAAARQGIGGELNAQFEHWYGEALADTGDRARADDAWSRARQAIDAVLTWLPESDRPGVLTRPDIRAITRAVNG